MPTYVFEPCDCEEGQKEIFELNVPIESRDTVCCGFCGQIHKRKIAFNGLTWAPTAGGMR